MDKRELRGTIRTLKRQMTETEIAEKSNQLCALFTSTDAYRNAKSLYGYMSYNQEVRTVPMLERALKDGKRIAVPKVIGDEMVFIYMEDLARV